MCVQHILFISCMNMGQTSKKKGDRHKYSCVKYCSAGLPYLQNTLKKDKNKRA